MMRGRGGFTLIELMIAMAIVTFGLLTILGLFAATVLMAQRAEVDLVTDVAYSNAVQAVEAPGFSAELLGNVNGSAPFSVPIDPGDEFAYADEPNGLIKGKHSDYAITVSFGATAISQWFSIRPAFDGVSPPPPGSLPGEVGLRYVTIHTAHIDAVGQYTGSPHSGEVLNELVLIGVAPDELDN